MRRSIPAAFCRYAVPQMFGLLFNSVYFVVDGVFIGNRLGRDAMAAAGVAVPMLELMIALSMAIASGSGVMVSLSLAQKRREEADSDAMSAVIFTGVLGLLLAVFGNIFIGPLSAMLGSTPLIQHDVQTYLSIILTLAPFMLWSFVLGGLVRNDGHPVHAMIALSTGSLMNIFLDWLFMYPLNMGIAGAALATALGPVLSVLILLPHFIMKRGSLHLRRFAVRLRSVGRMIVLGIPAFVMEFTIGMITYITNLSISNLNMGEIGLAAYLLIGYLMLIILTLFLGMAEGLQPVFSSMQGSADREGLSSMLRFSAFIFAAVGLVCYVLVYVFSDRFYGLFTAGDQVLLQFAAGSSRAYFSGFTFAGMNILFISFWQATEKTDRSMLTALLRSALLPPVFIILLPVLLGQEWFWYGHSISEVLTALAVLILVLHPGRGAICSKEPLSVGKPTPFPDEARRDETPDGTNGTRC